MDRTQTSDEHGGYSNSASQHIRSMQPHLIIIFETRESALVKQVQRHLVPA